jgi:hypothetical protein
MLVRIQAAQQGQTANPATQRTTERPERPERPEQPERPELAYPSGAQGRELRDQIRQSIRAAQEAAADARNAQGEANQVRVQNGLPVVPPIPAIPPIPGIQVHTGGPADVIPPQAVDISIAFFVMCAVMVIGWPLARAFGRRLERSGHTAAVSPVVSEQLLRIEQAVEAMSIEVERISESQRYLAKVQSATLNESTALESGDRR